MVRTKSLRVVDNVEIRTHRLEHLKELLGFNIQPTGLEVRWHGIINGITGLAISCVIRGDPIILVAIVECGMDRATSSRVTGGLALK